MADLDYVDSLQVEDSEILWRVIPPEQHRPNAATMSPKISEGAFRTQEVSVYRASRVNRAELLARFPAGSLIAAFAAGFARNEGGCLLVLDPDDNSHVMMCRKDSPTKRLTGSQANAFIRALSVV